MLALFHGEKNLFLLSVNFQRLTVSNGVWLNPRNVKYPVTQTSGFGLWYKTIPEKWLQNSEPLIS
jgi:hypothetical protein